MRSDVFTASSCGRISRHKKVRLGFRVFLSVIACLACGAGFAASSVEWQVLNRFRAFDYMGSEGGQDLNESVRLFAAYSPALAKGDGDRLMTEEFKTWSARLAVLGSPYAERSGPWNEAAGGWDPGYKSDFVELPAQMSVKAILTNATRLEATCRWKVDDQLHATQPCSIPFDFTLRGAAAKLEVQPTGEPPLVTEVRPQLRIILGLGDSYAAGQGSPDLPTQWNPTASLGTRWVTEVAGEGGGLPLPPRPPRWMDFAGWQADRLVERPAVWHSPRCDRSFWSYQNLVALHTAAEDPHAVVAFVHLACSGAEVINGLLAPQRSVAGRAYKQCKGRKNDAPVDPACDAPKSQVRAAIDALCTEKRRLDKPDEVRDLMASLQGVTVEREGESALLNELAGELRSCPAGSLRRVDTVLLSIGGNDVGFAGVIMWALAPSRSRLPGAGLIMDALYDMFRKKEAVCPSPAYKKRFAPCAPGTTAEERIRNLPARYSALNKVFTRFLEITPSRVLLNGYPDSLWSSTSQICGQKPYSSDNNQWSAIYAAGPRITQLVGALPGSNPFQVNLTHAKTMKPNGEPDENGKPNGEADAIHEYVTTRVNETASAAAQQLDWKFAANENVMKEHGWCVGPPPRTSPIDGPRWDALADEGRWIRTLDDAFMTQWSAPSVTGRADGISGTFHPNLQGYAAMAEVANRVLQGHSPQYSNGLNAEPRTR